ncbi:acyltransferase domain-containing protein [Butyrivibrio sp. JL13D10]|uniref:acyltransferase domain-containing protein n=1 Tax=Butyrivibrio sp. JL13D10 TaxID=3236815 RepID=UPI0038B63040
MSLDTIHEKTLISLLQKIRMPREVTDDILVCAKNGNFSFPGINELTSHILTALKSREEGDWKPFPEDIFIATMGCFSRFVNEHYNSYNSYGFDRAFWTTRQAGAKLFRIGELEYEFEDGDDKYIHLHIPSDAKLSPDLLNGSVQKARDFWEKYYPERKQDPIVVETWLLSPSLEDLLPPDSRIIAFKAAFDITDYDPDAKDCLEWVFKIPGALWDSVSLEDLPEDTTLQHNMKKLLLDGGHVGIAKGILARPF